MHTTVSKMMGIVIMTIVVLLFIILLFCIPGGTGVLN